MENAQNEGQIYGYRKFFISDPLNLNTDPVVIRGAIGLNFKVKKCINPTPTGWFLGPYFFADCWVHYCEIDYFCSHTW